MKIITKIQMRSIQMQIDERDILSLAEKLNISKDEIIAEGVKSFLEKKLREIKTQIYEIHIKHNVSSVHDFELKYEKGEVEEKDTWSDLQRLDHLEYKKDEIEKILADFQ